jgi:hypothetical protein
MLLVSSCVVFAKLDTNEGLADFHLRAWSLVRASLYRLNSRTIGREGGIQFAVVIFVQQTRVTV